MFFQWKYCFLCEFSSLLNSLFDLFCHTSLSLFCVFFLASSCFSTRNKIQKLTLIFFSQYFNLHVVLFFILILLSYFISLVLTLCLVSLLLFLFFLGWCSVYWEQWECLVSRMLFQWEYWCCCEFSSFEFINWSVCHFSFFDFVFFLLLHF